MLIGADRIAMSGKKLTARDYIAVVGADAITSMWDGIENNGFDSHSENLTVWKDLVGSNNFKLNFTNTYSDRVVFDISKGTNSTITFPYGCLQLLAILYPATVRCQIISAGDTYSGYGLCCSHLSDSEFVYSDSYDKGNGPNLGNGDNKTIALYTINKNGVVTVSAYKNTTLITDKVPVGSRYANSGTGIGGNSYKIGAQIFSLRLFSRNLTASEVFRLYAIDKARFNLT